MFFIQDFIQYLFILLFNEFILFNIIIVIFSLIMQSFFIRKCESNNINICSINWFNSSLSSIQSYMMNSVYTNYINSISWLYKIYMVFICTEMESLRGFSLWYSIRGLLHFNMLFIWESTMIMHHFKSKSLLALGAKVWFCNFTSFEKNILFFLTFDASKACSFHFRNGTWITNYNTFKLNQFINMNWIKLSNLIDFSHIIRSHLDDLIIIIFHYCIAIFSKSLRILILKVVSLNLGSYKIKNGNDVSWIILKESIKLGVIIVKMLTINI